MSECSRRNELFGKLSQKVALIYSSPSIGIKYIGMGVFRDCSKDEEELYQKYLCEINKINSLSFDVEKCDVTRLCSLLEEILRLGDIELDQDLVKNKAHELHSCINKLSVSEVKDIFYQYDNYIKALDYKDNAFYRHNCR